MSASRAIAIFLLVGTLVPLANLIPGGETDPLAGARLADWLLGTLLCVTVGVLAAYVQHLRRKRGAPPAVAVAAPSDDASSAHAPIALILEISDVVERISAMLAGYGYAARRYDPITRRLAPARPGESANTLFVRTEVEAGLSARLASATSVNVLGTSV